MAIETKYDAQLRRLRRAARPDVVQPEVATAYLEKTRLHAYRVTDRDVEELREAGLSEDEIFDATVSVAVASGLERIAAGLRALE